MRVAFVNPVGAIGGAERVLLSVMASLRRADPGTEVRLIAGTAGPLVRRAEAVGAAATVLPMPAALTGLGDSFLGGSALAARGKWVGRLVPAAGQTWGYTRRLGQELREWRPDLIHSNGIKTHLLLALCRDLKAPVVWHVHDFLGARRVASWLLRWARRRAAGAVAVSEAVAADLRKLLPGFPVRVVANTIDVEAFSPGSGDGAWLDRLAGLPTAAPKTVRVGLVATFARWKGHDVFLEAAACLVKEPPANPVRFFVIGGPIYATQGSQFTEAELRTLAQRLHIDAHVGFVPFQDDPVPVYRALDVVVHASTRPEPFGLTIAEAMACGRPVVVSQAGGAAELFNPGHDALGVPPGDSAALAAAIRRLVDAPSLRQSLSINARQAAVQRFDSHRLGPQILSAYRAFLPRNQPGPSRTIFSS